MNNEESEAVLKKKVYQLIDDLKKSPVVFERIKLLEMNGKLPPLEELMKIANDIRMSQ